MSEFKGTPGPWFWENSVLCNKDFIIGGNGHTFHNQANKNLLAAAPELLEALERIIICAENIGGEHVTGLMDLDNSVEFARMKLNKALGQ